MQNLKEIVAAHKEKVKQANEEMLKATLSCNPTEVSPSAATAILGLHNLADAAAELIHAQQKYIGELESAKQ